jgi:PAS domain S-box-containing protein
VVENVEDFAVYTKDLGGRILSWNPGVERLLGYAEDEWVGQHVSIIFTQEDLEGAPSTRS